MGDPLSIASGVAGLVTLGLTICNGLNTYFSAIKDRGEDIESASQLLALLRSNIDIIGSSTSTLSNRYSRATQGITAGLKLCQHQLKVLNEVVNSLNIPNGIPNTRRWQKQKAVVIYPFNRHKLLQVQDQLLKATGVLGTFVQTLILNINISMGEDLQAIRNATNNSNLVTDNLLRNVNDSIDTIGPSIQQNETQLTTISTRVEEQTALASTTHALVHEVNLKLSTLVSGVEKIRISSYTNKDRSLESNASLQLPRNVIESERNRSFLAERCNCRPSRTRPAYRRARQSLQSWGWITVSKRVELQENHRLECPFYAVSSSKESTTTTISYTGLRHFFSRVLDLSLVRDGRAGAYSVSYGLRSYNVVNSSPVFDVISSHTLHGLSWNYHEVTETFLSLKNHLQLLYASHRTLRFDVDEFGRNIAHYCVERFGTDFWLGESPEVINKGLPMLRMLLMWLSDMGVNISAADFDQRTIVDLAVESECRDILPCVYDAIEECNPQLDLVMYPNGRWSRSWLYEWTDIRLGLARKFPDIFFERVDIVQGNLYFRSIDLLRTYC
ncbi:hypothetical protein FDECE_9446 [Fusarium decemcellulare]|nr:hypothetical protein FDECE_9446 [Fusarium decemcellulare]